MKPKKLSNTFRNSEHGEKAEPLVKGGQEIKMKGLLEEQESYYLQSSHLFRLDGADLEKPEAPFRASKQVMEKLQKDQATQNWFAERPGFGGDPDNTPIPEWYQELMGLLGPWMAGGGHMLFFHSNAGYDNEPHGYGEGAYHGFHQELWRIQREAREFVIQQLFDFDQDGVSIGLDPEVQDYIYNYLIDQNEANSWITPDMITPENLHGLGHYYSQTNPNYTGDLELRWIGPDGQQVLNTNGSVLGPTGWLHQWMNNGPGAEYALANEWQWPPSIDPFGLWQSMAEGAPMPDDPLNAMFAGSQFLVSMVNYQDITSIPEEYPEIDFDVDYEAAGYGTLYEYYLSTSALFAQSPIMLYYQFVAGGGGQPNYFDSAGTTFFYPHYLQQLFDTLGVDLDTSMIDGYSSGTGSVDNFFTGPGMESYQELLDLVDAYAGTSPGYSIDGMASMLQAYMSSNSEYGWNAQLGAFMDWYATGVEAGFIELSEAGYDTFEAAYTAYTGDPDNPFNWFWFDFSQEIGSDNFLNIYEYTLSPDGASPDWGQTFGAEAGYNEGGWYGNSTYDFDPQFDINFITTAEQYLDTFPPGNFTGSEGVPLWYQTIMSAYTTWAANGLSTNFGFAGTAADGLQNNQPGVAEQGGGHGSTAGNYFHQYTNYWVNLAFDHDGDGQFNENALLDLADQGFNFGQVVIDSINYQLAQKGLGPTTLTVADLTPEMFVPTSPPAGTINPVTGEEMSGWWWGHGAFYEADPQLYNLNRQELMSWANGNPNYASGGGEPHPYPGGIAGTPWHADFILTGPTGVFPPELDPLGIWEFNTNGEGPGFGLQMSSNLAQSYYFYLASAAAIQSFQMFGNVFQSGAIATNGNVLDLWAGNTQGQMDPEDAAHTTGSIVTWTWFHSINYLAGSDGLDDAGNTTTYGGVFQELVDALQVNNYNPETGLANYDPPDNNSWMFNLLYQYFHLQPGNPIMEESFFAEQEELFSWYLVGVVGMGDMQDISTWNGPLASEMSEEAINNFANALEAGTVFFDFTYGVTDPNFVYYTTQGESGNPIWMQFGTSFMEDLLSGPTINPSIGMGNLLGAEAAVDIQAFVQAHGGMIDYNGDGRVDVGDILGLISFHMSPQAYEAGMGFDMSVFAELGMLQTEGLAYFFQNNASTSQIAPNGSMNWMLYQQPSFDSGVFQPTNIFGGSFTGTQGLGSSFITILSTLVVFQFVNDFIDNGAVPEWYSSILDGELSASTSTFNDFLTAVYPEWTVWSSQNFNITFEDSTEYSTIYDELVALLPPQEVLVNYAAYYVSEGIDINQQFVVSSGNTINISSGGESLVDGLWEDLSSYSSQDFVVNVVSNNAEFFAGFDVNQDGEYGFVDNVAVTLIVALLMEYFAASSSTGQFEQLNIAEILFDLAENHASYSVMPYGDTILSNINAAEQFGGSTNVREALNYLLNVVQFPGFISTDPDAPSGATPEQVTDALLGMVTSVILSLYTTVGSGVTEVSPGVLDLGSLESSMPITLSSFIQAAFATFIENGDNNAILQTLFENTDGSYYVDADGNEIPFSFTAAGLQALASQGSSFLGGFGSEGPNEGLLSNIEESIALLTEEGLSIDFNSDGVYDINDINILLSIASEGPTSPEEALIAELLNVSTHPDTVDFDAVDIMFLVQYLGLPGETDLVFPADGVFGETTETPFVSYNMFGYFNEDGTWVDFDYDDLTPDDYFGPGWSATQTNNNETTS